MTDGISGLGTTDRLAADILKELQTIRGILEGGDKEKKGKGRR